MRLQEIERFTLREKRPTTASRRRTTEVPSEAPMTPAENEGVVDPESDRRIKNYLHKEFKENRFLSVSDYKQMTMQVKNLR